MNFKPYKNNIEIEPQSKNKIIGDTAKFYLYGTVLAVGESVNPTIAVGDTIGYTLFGINEIQEASGVKHYFIQDDPDFILGIEKRNTE